MNKIKHNRYDHGHSPASGSSPTYKTWANMIQRCENKNNKEYKNYGARGIFVCNRWKDFKNFLEDMGETPTELTLDRIDNDDGYYKVNCRWATITEQNRNSRACKLTAQQVCEIRILLQEGHLYQETIAKMYGIKQPQISSIKLNTSWRER